MEMAPVPDATSPASDWLSVMPGEQPLIVSVPHTGATIPPAIAAQLISPWLARKDSDWWIERLYDFAGSLGATVIRTDICRTVIDVNRDPTGVSLYPGQATTALCPDTTFDGEPLYRDDLPVTPDAVADRGIRYFDPYHHALTTEIARLRTHHRRIVLYDCHAIRSQIPRLFDGLLPNFNVGTNNGASCDPALTAAVERACGEGGDDRFTRVTNGRFKGGYITRHHGRPAAGVHAIQMELACRGYMDEPIGPVSESSWPTPYDSTRAAPMRARLVDVLTACLQFAIR
jgi:N-formylglutamate deformylase